jgi:DNA repair photolyase
MIIKKCGGLTSDIAPYYINPYTWCYGQCIYCWAGHYTKPNPPASNWIKTNIPNLLDTELNHTNISGNVWIGNYADAYQPIEKETKLTRSIIKILKNHGVKVTLLTKFALLQRDLDLEPDQVGISLISLNDNWRKKYEPNADTAEARIKNIETAHNIGIKTFILVEPLLRLEDFHPLYERLNWVDRFIVGKLNPRQMNRIDFPYPNYNHIKHELQKYKIEFKRNW